jgi:site-specific DNA recombinase
VLIFDVARFSRSLGTLWDVGFGRLRRLGVVVIDTSTNTRSDSPNARMVFGTMGLVSDLWCQMIGDETRKGLDARARKGFHPGGKTFGYTTVPEPNPENPQHPRKVRVVQEEQAKIVRLVFELYADGQGYKAIAGELNNRGVGAPHDGKRGNKSILGWGATTIRHMLMNEEYVGRDRWGAFRYSLLDDGKYEKAPQEDETKRVAYSVPVIVPPQLWQRVQKRLARFRGRGAGRPFGSGKHRGWLLSGLAKCGECGSPFTIVARRYKKTDLRQRRLPDLRRHRRQHVQGQPHDL